MIDKEKILERTDLLPLASGLTTLRKVAGTGGGEWAGPCPVCGGRDRFRVQPNRSPHGLWFCRTCTGEKWNNAIDLIIAVQGVDFKRACEILAGGDVPKTYRRPAPQAIPAYSPPSRDWQAAANGLISNCEDTLWNAEGKKALDYLRSRGLQDKTIERFRLGFHPRGKAYNPKPWGFEEGEKVYIEKGVTIPCIVAGEVWYIKIRTASRKQDEKYRGIKGNRTAAIFGADELQGASVALFCEGEFDAMIAWQGIRDVLPAVTLGAANNAPDLATWGPYLMGLDAILTVYDNDQAGQEGAATLAELTNKAKNIQLPEGVKDINDFVLGGGDLWKWIQPYLNQYAPIEGVL